MVGPVPVGVNSFEFEVSLSLRLSGCSYRFFVRFVVMVRGAANNLLLAVSSAGLGMFLSHTSDQVASA